MIFLAVLGLCLGSFVNAAVWRVYAAEAAKAASGKKTKKAATSRKNVDLAKISVWNGRSMCPECHTQLAAKDLMPVLSWVLLRGKCRYCRKPISWQYPAVEAASALLFALSYAAWPGVVEGLGVVQFALWLILLVISLFLFVYDLRWMILPTGAVYFASLLGVAMAVVTFFINGDVGVLTGGLFGSLLFGGFFYVLYIISGGRWIGGGDVRLGFALGILLGWQGSIITLALASYIGTATIGLLVLFKKYHKKMKLPFGPFLLSAAFMTVLWGQSVIDWYLRLSGVR